MLEHITAYSDIAIEELEKMVSEMLESWYMGDATDLFDKVLKLRGILQDEILRRDNYGR